MAIERLKELYTCENPDHDDFAEQSKRLKAEIKRRSDLFHDNVKLIRNHLNNLKRFLGKPTKKPLDSEQVEQAKYYVGCVNDYVNGLNHNLADLAVLTDVKEGAK